MSWHIEFARSPQAREPTDASICTALMEIVEQDLPANDEAHEPPFWLLALGLSVALLIGIAQAGHVKDPRLANQPSPTPCVPTVAGPQSGPSLRWVFC